MESNDNRTYRKHFIPLESNPEVFTELVHKLGLSKSLSFQDVLSLDDPELLAFIPRPAYALILVAPTTAMYEKRAMEEDAEAEYYEGFGEQEDMVFFKQTIHNACGLYGILHAVTNGDARRYIQPNSVLAHLLEKGIPLKPDERAAVLEDSAELESVYASVASKGDTEAPRAEDEVDFHYICLVRSHRNGRLFQMDGDRKRPIDLGELGEGDDILSDALGVVRGMVERDKGENLNYSLMALVPTHD
ncbi:cysteine proteinase [Zopfia rhizophila CBS 207.26]|uniref:Ubiquitin carboxyl-terminal hydrolase n=1 Tax=Zopfia rhizophila CBS 207.26 TaxID=1314779 RepID=A0A6A6E6Y3_9PEZI|nr:cysteine proteinase [Zopfia rhizophila CBS 207.26]